MRVFILIVGLIGLLEVPSLAQESAQATMQVSLRVVSGSSVEFIQPEIIKVSEGNKYGLGILTMKGVEEGDVFISNSESITLSSPQGDEVKMNIFSQQEENSNATENIRYEGVSKGTMINNTYTGELTTTIEYL